MSDQLGKSLQHSVNQKFGSGTYQVLQPIKRGADGYVYKIQYIKQKRLGALKVLPRHKLSIEPDSYSTQSKKKYKPDNSLQQKAQNQIKIHEQLRSNYIVKLYNSSKDDMNFYIFLQYISKGDLGDQISKYRDGFNINQVRKIGLQLAKGIDTINKKSIVHRDIKPQNLLLTQEDDIKICDFSCAKVLNKNGDQLLIGAVGTLQYMAPQILGKYDNSVDVWSCGCVLFTMATGRPPFKMDKNQITQYIRRITQSKINQFNSNLTKTLLQISAKHNSKQYNKISLKCSCKNNTHPECYKKLADLLKKIFVFNVNKRIKIYQIIQHPFFTGQQMQFEQQIKKLQTIEDYQANTKRQGYNSSTGIVKNYNRTMRESHKITQQNLSKLDKEAPQKITRPKTSYSLQNIKKAQNTLHYQQKQKQLTKKMVKTQAIINQHKQRINANNKTNIAAYMNKLSQQRQKDKQKQHNNQNVNILNIDNYRRQKQKEKQKYNRNRQQRQGINNVEQLFKHKLTDKYNTNNTNPSGIINQNRSSLHYKYISDGKQIKPSHNQSQNSSNPTSLRHMPQALNTQGINFILRYPQKQQIITINEQGLKGQFTRSNKIMLISPKGKHITLSFQGKNKKYELERLPQKYMALYESYRQIVNGLRKKAKSVAKTSRQKQIKQHNKKNSPQQHYSTQNSQHKKSSQQKQMADIAIESKSDITLKIQLFCNIPSNPTKYQYKAISSSLVKKQFIISLTKKQIKNKIQTHPYSSHTNSHISISLSENNNIIHYAREQNSKNMMNILQNQINIEQIRRIFLELIDKVILGGNGKDRSQRERNLGVIMENNYQSIQFYTQVLHKYCQWLLVMPKFPQNLTNQPKIQSLNKQNNNLSKPTNTNSNKSSAANLNICMTQTGVTQINKQSYKNQMTKKQKERENYKHYDHRILLDTHTNTNKYR